MINKVKILLTMLFLAGFLALSCDNSCCAEEAPEVKEKVTLTGVSVVSYPTKMLYVAGEKFEPAGMLVKAHYSDGKEKELKDGEYTYSPVGALTENNTNITVSYTEDGVKKETAVSIKMGYNITVAKCENGTVECALERAEEKTRINVTATADKGYYLTSLSYKYYDSQNKPIVFNLEVGEGVTEYSFDMPSYDITIEAVFSADKTPRYSIELNKTGEKDQAVVTFIYGSVNSEEVVQKDIFEGTEITFTVSPNSEDYYVPEIPQIAYNGETKDVEVVDLNTGKYKFTMPGANVVVNVAIAKWGTYKLSTNVNGGKGTVKLTADGKEIVGDTFLAVGTEIKAVVTPADDYEISFVKFNSEVLDADDDGSYTFKMGEENAALEVMFAEIKGNEVVQGAVVNGKLEISHVLAKPATNVTITAIPDEGYVAVESLKVTTADSAATEIPCQKVSESGNVYSFVMPESAVTVSAVFRGYLVTVNTSENGTVTADVASAKAGDKITLTAIAKEKNALGTISVKAGEDSLKNTRTDLESGKAEITFTMPASDVEIDATFDKAVSVTADYTPDNAGLIELYQGKTYITLGNTMYFANGTELTLETTPGTIGDGIYEVGAGQVKAIAANDKDEELDFVTEITKNEKYKITIKEIRDFAISVVFSLSNAKRVFITKDFDGGTVVVEDNGTTVTSSSDSWLGGDAYIIDGHTVTVKATADVGYTVGTIKWNGKNIANGGEFSMPKEQVEITATFEKDSYPLNFKSSVANGKFTLSSDFTFDADKGILSPAGKTYGNGDKVPYKEIVYIIATPSNSDYMEQITVMNETEGQAIRLDRLNTVSKPYQFEMPASASGVTANISFEFAGSDVNLWVNGSPVTSFYLNPSPDKATWGTLEKEYYIRYKNAEGYWCQGYPLKKGDKVQIKDKNGNPLTSYEYALGFDETNPNYNMATSTYTAEGDGVYKMYYKLWKDGTYSMWIQIPKTGALADADYFFTLNGQKVEKLAVTVSLTQKEIDSGIVKQFYIKNVDLQKGDSVGIETNASAIPDDGILHWEHGEDEKGNDWNKLISRENDGKPFKIPAAGEYDFYFKVWQDGGTSIWIEESKPVVTP
ncbi:MAG: bacterial Ig-like domain-containing protein [Spirochaetota bacterium]|nr:bacterial Ig-like domain-containing protein [Spirochaetota bacterium]